MQKYRSIPVIPYKKLLVKYHINKYIVNNQNRRPKEDVENISSNNIYSSNTIMNLSFTYILIPQVSLHYLFCKSSFILELFTISKSYQQSIVDNFDHTSISPFCVKPEIGKKLPGTTSRILAFSHESSFFLVFSHFPGNTKRTHSPLFYISKIMPLWTSESLCKKACGKGEKEKLTAKEGCDTI